MGARAALVAVVCALVLLAGVGSASAETKTFTTQGCGNTVPANLFTVPAGVGSVQITATGSAGQTEEVGLFLSVGGTGDVASGTLSGLSAGQVLDVCVNSGGGAGGFTPESRNGGAGGGASGVALGSDFSSPVLIAAGGGGGGFGPPAAHGGSAGTPSGEGGGTAVGPFSGQGGGGGNNTTMMGGKAGAGAVCPPALCTAGTAGAAFSPTGPGAGGPGGGGAFEGGGGGGAGHYGGGGGGGGETGGGGGGGGSDFCGPALTGTTLSGCGVTGSNSTFGTASVTITYEPCNTKTGTATFNSTGEEQCYVVPVGVTSVHVAAVGGEGGTGLSTARSGPAGAGGLGAVVSDDLGVKAGETLYVEVGVGGGSAGLGGGGGGASDVREVPIGKEPSPGNKASLESRLLVAAGGGGGGGTECEESPGGAGGNADEAGQAGLGCAPHNGGGGGAGTSTKGGAGGSTESPSEKAGVEGALGVGGLGDGFAGAGGGGLYGGGSGGEGFTGGGGGGGSNLVPAGGSHQLAAAGQAASVTFTPITPPDLSLENVASPSPVVSGNTLTYTITVTNPGSETAKDVRLEDQLPESAVFGSFSSTQGTCNRKPGPTGPKTKDGSVLCELGSLEGGKTATITVTVTPTKAGSVNAKAVVKASNVTSDANDEETANTTVLGE
jgi:uncharacterized repeat protein (TIGR01451 family)